MKLKKGSYYCHLCEEESNRHWGVSKLFEKYNPQLTFQEIEEYHKKGGHFFAVGLSKEDVEHYVWDGFCLPGYPEMIQFSGYVTKCKHNESCYYYCEHCDQNPTAQQTEDYQSGRTRKIDWYMLNGMVIECAHRG